MGKDYYDILGVTKEADEAELKKGSLVTATCALAGPTITNAW